MIEVHVCHWKERQSMIQWYSWSRNAYWKHLVTADACNFPLFSFPRSPFDFHGALKPTFLWKGSCRFCDLVNNYYFQQTPCIASQLQFKESNWYDRWKRFRSTRFRSQKGTNSRCCPLELCLAPYLVLSKISHIILLNTYYLRSPCSIFPDPSDWLRPPNWMLTPQARPWVQRPST